MGSSKIASSFLYLIAMLVVAIDTFMYYINFIDEELIYIGALTHLAILLFVDTIWAERKNERFVYYATMLCNYLLLIPKYILGLGWRIGVDTFFWDLILSVVFVLFKMENMIIRFAKSAIFTGLPMSKTKISPPLPIVPASSTSLQASGMSMK